VKPASAILAARSSTANTIVLVGPAGSGKTSLATALLVERAVAAVEPEDPYGDPYRTRRDEGMFVTTFALAKARREHQLGKGDAGIITHATDAIILLVDELGAEANRGDTAVPEVIHERHAWDRPTIYTTPFELDELERRYGSGIARRVFEGASVIRLGGAR
jgi:DNA replication protein DnaC